jgi:integrase/recombinase XerC
MTNIHNFIHYLTTEKHYSKLSIRSYQTDLNQFYSFLESQLKSKIAWGEIDHTHIRQFIQFLSSGRLTNRTINRKLSALKSFYKFLIRENVVESSPFKKVVSPKTTKRLPTFVEETNMNQLFDSSLFSENFSGVRNKLMLELFYFTGMRLSELINLTLTDIDIENSTVKVLGKRNKERIIPLTTLPM